MDGQMKIGWRRGGKVSVPCPLAASQTFRDNSGAFVYLNGSGHAVLADDGADEIFGYAEVSSDTYSSTAGADFVNVIIDPSAIFRIPVAAGTYVITMRGKTCDLLIDGSSIQGADLSNESADNILIIVDGDAVDNKWVEVMISQNERAQGEVV